jgi:hypothetical protein
VAPLSLAMLLSIFSSFYFWFSLVIAVVATGDGDVLSLL